MYLHEGRSTVESLVGEVPYSFGQIEVLKAGAFPEGIILDAVNRSGQAEREEVFAIGEHGRAVQRRYDTHRNGQYFAFERKHGLHTAGFLGDCKVREFQAVFIRETPEDVEGVRFVSLEEVLRNADFISLHCPLNDQTRHLVNKETLALMKPTAFIINTSRGPLINEEDLIEALKTRKIAGAGLDVQEVEPLSASSPLFALDNVIVTPHMGWKGLETRQRLVSILKEGIDGYRRGEKVNRVD